MLLAKKFFGKKGLILHLINRRNQQVLFCYNSCYNTSKVPKSAVYLMFAKYRNQS